MRTRVARLNSAGGTVGVAWFMGDTGESFLFGKQPEDLSTEVEADDYQPIIGCRFMASGSVIKENQFRQVTISQNSEFEETGNLDWCRFTIQEDNTIGFCLDISNPKYRFVRPHRVNLGAWETQTLGIFGYLAVASGSITVDGREVAAREIVTLTGVDVEIKAGAEGAQVGAMELEYA